MVRYDKNGNCTKCGLPGSGFVEDGVCTCLDEDERPVRAHHWYDTRESREERRQLGFTALD